MTEKREPRPTFVERVAALVGELERVAATAQHRVEQRRSEGRRLSPALHDRLAALAGSTRALADALDVLATGHSEPRSAAQAAIDEAARAGGYDLDS